MISIAKKDLDYHICNKIITDSQNHKQEPKAILRRRNKTKMYSNINEYFNVLLMLWVKLNGGGHRERRELKKSMSCQSVYLTKTSKTLIIYYMYYYMNCG